MLNVAFGFALGLWLGVTLGLWLGAWAASRGRARDAAARVTETSADVFTLPAQAPLRIIR